MRFETADIDRYGPLKGCRPTCDDGITIIAGPNESGKTLYLEGLLQLMEPDVTTYMQSGPRVEQRPTGRIVINDGSDRHTLGNGTALSDISLIKPNHLYNLFIIRDSDLALPDGPDYYTSLVEHLGDIHTSEIEKIREKLVERGRLTPTNLNLANREYNTKDVKRSAESLAKDIESYLETVEERGISETIRERLQIQRELTTVETRLSIQRTAEEVVNFEDADEQFQEYVDATEELQNLAAFDRETLDQLRNWEQERSLKNQRIEELETSLETKQDEVERHRKDLKEERDRYAELQQRESDVDEVESALESYRNQTDESEGVSFEAQIAQRRYVTIAALIGAGIAAGSGAIAGVTSPIALGGILLLVAIGAWISHRRLAKRVGESEAGERELLQKARDAGFNVEMPEEVAPLLQDYRVKFGGVESRIRDLEAKLEQATKRVEELEGNLSDAVSEREELQEQLTSTLEDADVESDEEYEERVEEKETQEHRRSKAETILTREFGDLDVDTPKEKIAYWEEELDEWESDIGETDVDADQYDEEELVRVQDRQSELQDKLGRIKDKLTDYYDELDKFEREANDLTPPPFVDTKPSLEARTTEGLRNLADELHELVATIERNATVSEKAIGILDAIKEDEEQKVATLFDPDGPASRLLSHITDGRYTAVDYDPDAEALEVTTADGRTFTPHKLSQGTRDQLYFAARLSLAQQLLGNETGFLLLDDPFLAADQTRLQNGFETLMELTDNGWQIVYLTAKQEVYESMAGEFGCEVYELDTVEH